MRGEVVVVVVGTLRESGVDPEDPCVRGDLFHEDRRVDEGRRGHEDLRVRDGCDGGQTGQVHHLSRAAVVVVVVVEYDR